MKGVGREGGKGGKEVMRSWTHVSNTANTNRTTKNRRMATTAARRS